MLSQPAEKLKGTFPSPLSEGEFKEEKGKTGNEKADDVSDQECNP